MVLQQDKDSLITHKISSSYTKMTTYTCFEARTAILYLESRAGTRTIDLIALNIFDSLTKSSSICSRGHLTGSKINSLPSCKHYLVSVKNKPTAMLHKMFSSIHESLVARQLLYSWQTTTWGIASHHKPLIHIKAFKTSVSTSKQKQFSRLPTKIKNNFFIKNRCRHSLFANPKSRTTVEHYQKTNKMLSFPFCILSN